MNYIQDLYSISQHYWIVSMFIGLISCFLESFLPVLPLIGIISANAIILGLFKGMVISWIGSSLGTILLYLIVIKFKDKIYIKNIKSKKINNIMEWIKKQGFKLLFIAYSCPFIPAFLITIAAALSGKEVKNFIPAMLTGKFVMFLIISYPTSDINAFIRSPLKITFFIFLVFLTWKIGNKVNSRLDKNE